MKTKPNWTEPHWYSYILFYINVSYLQKYPSENPNLFFPSFHPLIVSVDRASLPSISHSLLHLIARQQPTVSTTFNTESATLNFFSGVTIPHLDRNCCCALWPLECPPCCFAGLLLGSLVASLVDCLFVAPQNCYMLLPSFYNNHVQGNRSSPSWRFHYIMCLLTHWFLLGLCFIWVPILRLRLKMLMCFWKLHIVWKVTFWIVGQYRTYCCILGIERK